MESRRPSQNDDQESLASTSKSDTQSLFALAYAELKRLADDKLRHERWNHTLHSTALVHEVYCRIYESSPSTQWDSKGHFFAAAAEAMRRILIDHARKRNAAKRGGGTHQKIELDPNGIASPSWEIESLLDLDEGIDRLSQSDPQAAEMIKLRVFAGLSISEAGELLGLSRKASYRLWDYARAWSAANLQSPS